MVFLFETIISTNNIKLNAHIRQPFFHRITEYLIIIGHEIDRSIDVSSTFAYVTIRIMRMASA